MPAAGSAEMRAMGVGLDFAAMVGASTLFGWIMWNWLGSRTWIWVWLGIGLVCASWKLYKDARVLNRDLSRAERRGSEQDR